MDGIFPYEERFVPPRENKLACNLTKTMMPFILDRLHLRIKVSPDCIDKMRSLRGSHCVLAPNHSDQNDPVTMVALSRICHEDFFYISARELYDKQLGLPGLLMQHCGAYSVIRGEPDADYVQKTMTLITQAHRKLVMFPEGDVTGLEVGTEPVQPDGLEILFKTQERMLSQGVKESVILLPLALTYQVSDSSNDGILKSIEHLELFLSIKETIGDTTQDRILRIANNLMEQFEHYYGKPRRLSYTSLRDRVLALTHHVTALLAAITGMRIDSNEELSDEFHRAVGRIRKWEPLQERSGAFGSHLAKSAIERSRNLEADCQRIQQLFIFANTLKQPFTPMVMSRLLDRLEIQLLGKKLDKGSRTVWIEAGDPIRLLDRISTFRIEPKIAITELESDFRSAIARAQSQVPFTRPEPLDQTKPLPASKI